ncbi:uncharacterized protein LOC124663832 isoform X2 [Lolium rigidum]|uniref:uncharacterized protein LOC124663832 isoform X2 n=1 Tax=Lolium rigidum TaxID=89674 RepID=UPI001F5C7160|nr:uncharacterized protein LOC124663832 isoform X2 [Lolium rigidum]
MASSSASSSTGAAVASVPGTTSGGSIFPGPPPPTPSNHKPLPSTAAGGTTEAALSAFLNRMLLSTPAPTLRSRPSSRLKTRTSAPPIVSLDSPDLAPLCAAADVGYFHLAGHGIPSQLPSSALSEISLLDAAALRATNLCTLGFSEEDQEEADGGDDDPAMVFDVDERGMDALPAAVEYARRMREVGMKVVQLLSRCPEVGFAEEPFAEGKRKPRCLVWVSKAGTGESAAAPPAAGKAKAYPYVLGLHSQWEQEAAPSSWVMDDNTGEWTAVGASDSALLITIGDIAQVWSNGKLKKVRGMARPTSAPSSDGNAGEPGRLSITVLITLPLDSVISPLVPPSDAGEEGLGEDEEKEAEGADGDGDEWKFRSFSLEDYAWRVYHERLQFKDPLARYRI